jgi:intracellular septation protein
MKFFFEFLPIVVFFAVYKFFGVFAATAATIGVTLLQVVVHWIQYRRVPSFLLLSLILVVLLGGSTLLFHNVLFIKWKPSVLYWVLSTVFLGSQLFQEKPIMQRLLEKTATSIMLPRSAWHSLNLAWAIFLR